MLFVVITFLAACGPGPAAAPVKPAPSGPTTTDVAAVAAAAARPLTALKTAYTTASASQAPVWTALESGAFAELGFDAEVVFIGAGQAILGALSSQEAPIVMAGSNQVVEANLQGGQYVMLGSALPYLTNSIYVDPSIQRPDDLRGKTVEVSNFGAISHVALKVALDHWGLEEGTDVTVIRSGGTPETLAAMQSGAIQGGAFSPPQTLRARDLGFRELIDVSALRYEMGGSTIVFTRGYVGEQAELVERYLKALMRGAYVFKTNKDLALDVVMKYGRIDDRAVAEETWAYYREKLNEEIVLSPSAVENNLRLLADRIPDALSARPEQFLDGSVVERIRASGYLDQVRQGR